MKRMSWHWGLVIGLTAVLMGSSIGCNPTSKPTTTTTTTKPEKQTNTTEKPVKQPPSDPG